MPQIELNPTFKYVTWALPAALLFFVPQFTDPINMAKLLVLVSITITATVMYLALRSYSNKKLISGLSKIGLLTYFALALTLIFTGFAGSNNFTRILFGATGRNNGLIYYLSVIFLAAIILNLTIGKIEIDYLERIFGWTSIIFAVYCCLQLLNIDPVNWANPYNRIIGTLGNPNFSASILAIFSVFWLHRFSTSKNDVIGTRSLFLILSIIMLSLSWATDSLQGVLVFIVGLSLVFFMYVRERVPSKIFPFVFFVLLGTTLLLLFLSFLGFGPLGELLEQYTLKLRGWYAYFGLLGMVNNLWTGVGVDNYIDAFRMYRTREFVVEYGTDLVANNAHSSPFQIGASFGIVAFVLYCLIHLLISYKALKIVNSRNSLSLNYKRISLIWILVFAQSLLSIEVIGLGVINWILGAIILSVDINEEKSPGKNSIQHKDHDRKKKSNFFPAWTGALAIATTVTGLVPFFLVYEEDRAYQRITYGKIIDETGKSLVQKEYAKLNSLTFAYPDRLAWALGNLYEANLESEIEQVLKNLQRIEGRNAQAADLLSTFYKNTNHIGLEVIVREGARDLDPWNEKLELALATAYSELGEKDKLRKSVQRLEMIAIDSQEFQEALQLLKG